MSRSPNQANQEKQTKNQRATNNNNLSQSISNQNSMMESQNNQNKGNQQSQNDQQPQTNQPVYPVRPYLERNLVPIVQQALIELDKVRPDDPLEYLGEIITEVLNTIPIDYTINFNLINKLKMKIFIRAYQNPMIGNTSTDQIIIKSNEILVSQLKDILFEKYHIEKSQQRLTVKIANTILVTMTNEWPLKFFYIKEHSIIFLEFIQVINKSEEISKKVLTNYNSKYLKSLGLMRHFSPPPMGTIVESQNEYIDELLKHNHINKESKLSHQSLSRDDISEVIFTAVKNNNIQQFRELIEQYDLFDVNKKSTKNGWAPIHFAAYYGFSTIMHDLVTKYKADVNLVSFDGWSALQLASYKGHQEIVRLLMSLDSTNIDISLPEIGTALHCACKRNNLQIASLLLHKANPLIKDSTGKLPDDLTTDKNIHNLIKKILLTREKKKMNDTNEAFLNELAFKPPRPPKTYGKVEKMGKLIMNYNKRYLEINPSVGSLIRYSSILTNKQIETIPLTDIVSCCKLDSWFTSSTYHYLELIYTQRQVYRFPNKDSCEKWIEAINKSIMYYRYWNSLMQRNDKVLNYFMKQNKEQVCIDFNTGKVFKIQKMEDVLNPPKEEERNNNNNHMNNIIVPKKKQRRPNPFTKNEQEEILIEDSTLTKGITFNSFEIMDCLGAGTFGKVFKVRLVSNGEIYAMKIINKKYLQSHQQLRYAVTECNVLKQAQSPFIITLHYAFQTPDNLYMILDYCPGGDLSFHIIHNLFEEDEAKFFIAELLLGIEHLHSLDIIYRDLKPENILIYSDGHIKLADFGLAKENVSDLSITKSFCGTPAYLAPEMLNRRGVGKAADYYGIGAVLYEMICGSPPFYSNDINTMYRNIANSNLMLHDYFSDELKDLLKQLLNRDPKNRLGVKSKDEIKNHDFFLDIDWDKLERKEIPPPINLMELKKEMEEDNSCKIISFKDHDYEKNGKDSHTRVPKFTFVRPHSPENNFILNKSSNSNNSLEHSPKNSINSRRKNND